MNSLETDAATVAGFNTALLQLDRPAAKAILAGACDSLGPVGAIEAIVIPCLEDMGRRFEAGELSLSQIYMAGRICDEIVDDVLPERAVTATKKPSIAIAVLEDHHSLGKKIVYLTLRSAGYEIVDLGIGLSIDELVQKVLEDEIGVLLISVLMLPSALKIRDVRTALDESPAGRAVKIVVGGAPFRFDDLLWLETGADAVANNASDAINVMNSLTGEGS